MDLPPISSSFPVLKNYRNFLVPSKVLKNSPKNDSEKTYDQIFKTDTKQHEINSKKQSENKYKFHSKPIFSTSNKITTNNSLLLKRTSQGITAKSFREFQEYQNKKRSEKPAINQAMHEQDLLELEKEAELKELTQSLHIESQAFNKSRQNKKNVPLPLKTPNFENVSFERSKTTNFVLKNRPDSSERKRSENTVYKSVIVEQIEADVAKKVDSEQKEAVDNCLARFHAEQECKSQKRRDFDYYLKRRENTKLQLEKQMKIPVVTVPFAYEDATQIFGLTPEQQVRKDSNLSNNLFKNSVSNKTTSYETMLANIQKQKQVRIEEAMVLDKIQRDMKFDVSNRMKRNQSIKVNQTQVLMKQMALRRSKTDAEIRMMGMKSDTPFGCKMMELRSRPNPRPKSSLWNDWQNHRKLPCII